MSSYSKASVFIAIIFLGTSCQNSQKSQAGDVPRGMQKMMGPVARLAPFVYDQKAFEAPENRKKIQSALGDLKSAAHKIPEKSLKKMIGNDPLVSHNLRGLQDDLKQVEGAFQKGSLRYARTLMKNTMRQCFQCHSRTLDGPELAGLTPKSFDGRVRAVTEKAEFFVATRQFEKAIRSLETYLKSSVGLYDNPYEDGRALKMLLAILIRVKKDSGRALKDLNALKDRDRFSYYLKMNMENWSKRLNAWNEEKRVTKSGASLMKSAAEQQRLGIDFGFIDFLRASSRLHEELRSTSSAPKQAVIFHQLGRSYENLGSLGAWGLPETYYEACVRKVPQSRQSQICYRDYERNMILGYTGTRGTFLPEAVRKELMALKKISGL